MDLNEPLRWIVGRGAALLVGAFVLLVIYRIGVSAIHRFVPAVINAQATHLPSGSSSADEVAKRIRTIEDLLLKLLRVAVLAGLLALALAVFELWTVLAAIVLLIVALLFATKDVVLDYVMGFLILVEGPYFKGDYVVVSDHPGAEGVVEEIGLRRTLLRDALGSSHAVSNGFIRLSSNLTRLFSVAVVEFHVLHAGELDRALAIAAKVAAVVASPNKKIAVSNKRGLRFIAFVSCVDRARPVWRVGETVGSSAVARLEAAMKRSP